MKSLLIEIRRAAVVTAVLALVCCGLYPLAVFGIAQICFPAKADGSLIRRADGLVIGSALVAQPFSGEAYFHPRPSAAGSGYDAANSSGSNLGPTSRKLRDAIAERIENYRRVNRISQDVAIPADAVTSSGSGLDPHISVANARLQSRRVARARGLTEGRVVGLIARHTASPDLGVLGEARVNVLTLNLALDAEPGAQAKAHSTP